MINPDIEKGMPFLPFEYQDWLADQGVIKRGNPDPARWDVTSPVNRSAVTRRLIAYLGETPGYLRTTRDNALHLYGADGRSELNATHHLALKSRSYLAESDSLFVTALYQGLGVDDVVHGNMVLSVNPVRLNSLYMLWKNKSKFVDSRLIADFLYQDVNHVTISNVENSCNGLNEMFSFSNAVVEGVDIDYVRYYRVRPVKDEEEKKRRFKNGFRDINYQDWLCDIGLMSQLPGFPATIKEDALVRDPALLSSGQKAAVDYLRKNGGYLVDTGKIAELYWDGQPPENWRTRLMKNLCNLRADCFNRSDIFSLKGDAWAVGVESADLTPTELNGLYELWLKYNRFIPASQFPVSRGQFTRTGLTNIRQRIEEEGYFIGSRGRTSTIEYILTHEDEIVRYEPGSNGVRE